MGTIIDSRPSPRYAHRLRWWGRLVFAHEDEPIIRKIINAASSEHTLKIITDNLDGTTRGTWEYEARGASREDVYALLNTQLQVHDVEEERGDTGGVIHVVRMGGHVYLSPRGHSKKLCACPGRGAFECLEVSNDIDDIVLGGLAPVEARTLARPQRCTCSCGRQLQGEEAWRGPATSGWVAPTCYVRLARERMMAK